VPARANSKSSGRDYMWGGWKKKPWSFRGNYSGQTHRKTKTMNPGGVGGFLKTGGAVGGGRGEKNHKE